MLTSTALLIWGGRTDFSVLDDSFYLLDLGTSNIFDVKTRPSSPEFLAFQYRESGPASWSVVPGPAVVTTIP